MCNANKNRNYFSINKPQCGACTMLAFNPAVDGKLFFCGATCDPDFECGPIPENVIFLGAKDADIQDKTPSRCPRLRDITLDKSVRGAWALDTMGLLDGLKNI